MPIVTVIEESTFAIDKFKNLTRDKSYVNDHYYMDKAPLPTLTVLPIVYLVSETGILNTGAGTILGSRLYALCGWLGASIPLAIILTIFIYDLSSFRSRLSLSQAVAISTIPIFTSYLFVFSGTFFGHLFAAMCLFLGYRSLRKEQFILAGFLGGLAFNSEYTLGLILLLWGIILVFQKKFKPALLYIAGLALPLLFTLFYNYYFTGSPFDFLYNHVATEYAQNDSAYGFQMPSLKALYGLLLSPSRGLLIYDYPLAYH